MKRNVLVVLLAILSVGLLVGVTGTVADSKEVVRQTYDGGQIVVGEDSKNNSIWIIKTDKNGTEQANYTFNGSGGNYGEPFYQTSDGGRITVKSPQRPSYSNRYTTVRPCAIRLIKTDVYGAEQWSKMLCKTPMGAPEDMHKIGRSVIQTSDGGYIVVGYKIVYVYDSHYLDVADVWIIKTDEEGKEQWNKTFTTGSDARDCGRLIIQTSDGGYVIVANARMASSMGSEKIWLIKISANGTKEWNNMFSFKDCGKKYYYFESIHQIDNGGYVIVGYTEFEQSGEWSKNTWIIKTDANGTKKWEEVFKKPDPTPTPEPTMPPTPLPTPTPPGFEAIFAIAGIVIVCLRMKKRRKI